MSVVRGARFTFWGTSAFAEEAICLCSRMCLIQFENKAGKMNLFVPRITICILPSCDSPPDWHVTAASCQSQARLQSHDCSHQPCLCLMSHMDGWMAKLPAVQVTREFQRLREGNATWFPVLWVISTHVSEVCQHCEVWRPHEKATRIHSWERSPVNHGIAKIKNQKLYLQAIFLRNLVVFFPLQINLD